MDSRNWLLRIGTSLCAAGRRTGNARRWRSHAFVSPAATVDVLESRVLLTARLELPAEFGTSVRIADGLNGGPAIAYNDYFGYSTAVIGDLNRDGVNDLAVGAPFDSTGGVVRGAVYVLLMNADGTAKSSVKIAHAVNGGPMLANNDYFGVSIAPLGDLDGDGNPDLAVGAAGDDTGGSNRGAVYILRLSAVGAVKSSTKIASSLNGGPVQADGDAFCVVASLGDLDRDGIVDIAVGAASADIGGTDRGVVQILRLKSDGTVKNFTTINNPLNGTAQGANKDGFGQAITNLGDLDGDGVV